jgi:hypothetical protein
MNFDTHREKAQKSGKGQAREKGNPTTMFLRDDAESRQDYVTAIAFSKAPSLDIPGMRSIS